MAERGLGYRKFKTPPARVACTSCRASRVRCSGTAPCSRCTRTGRSCVLTSRQARRSTSAAVQGSGRNSPCINVHSTVGVIDLAESATPDRPSALFAHNDWALLPPLFNDNVDAFQFDDIYLGNTETELDSFFADIFSLPTFPRQDVGVPTSAYATTSPIVYDYHSDAEVIQAYYHSIHPVFPILPPPVEEVVNDLNPWSATTHMPSSPLILALLGLLNQLAPLGNADQCKISRENRVDLSQQLARCALDAIDNKPPIGLLDLGSLSAVTYHPHIPSQLEVPMTYCVLSLYEYLCWGNIDQMTSLAQKAVAFFRNIIHTTEYLPHEVSRFDEAVRRAWWVAYLCTCNASAVSCKPPAEPVKIASVRIPYPSIGYDREVWTRFVRAEESIVAATLMLVALVKGAGTVTAVPSFNRSLDLLGRLINHQLAMLPVAPNLVFDITNPPECRLASCFQVLTRVRLDSARIKVHRYRAFMSDPRILRRFETVVSSSGASNTLATAADLAASNPSKACSIFPFTETYARRVCIDSASTIAHDLQQLLATGTIAAPAVCSAMIAGYTLMMISSSRLAANATLTEQKAMQTQCELGAKTAVKVLDSYMTGSGFLRGLRDQLQTAAIACEML